MSNDKTNDINNDRNEEMNCERCRDLLFDFHEGKLSPEPAAQVDHHLQSCDECSAYLDDIWQMSLVATRWQDQTPPDYGRQLTADLHKQSWRFPEVFAMAASIFAIVLVLTDARVETSDGVAIRFGGDSYLTAEHFEEYKTEQTDQWNQRLDELSAMQVASDQLVLRSVLQASREERREELTTLVSYWNTTQAQQQRETDENLRYLLASQAEDEKDIQQLSNAFRQINVQRGSNM